MLLVKLISFAALCCLYCEAARILTVVPSPSISHQVVFRPLTQELARRGHEVTVITTDPAFPKGQTPKNLREIDIHDFSYKAWRETLSNVKPGANSDDSFEQVKIFFPMLSEIFEMQMLTDDVKSVINGSNQYDLLIVEATVQPAIALSHLFKVPVISMSSFGGFMTHYDIVGAPGRPPLLFPTAFRQRLVNLSFWEKINEMYNHFRFENLLRTLRNDDSKMLKRVFGPDIPSITELNKNIDMLFLNVHPMWEFNRPMPPNAIYVGGLHQKPPKEIPEDLKTFLDSSKNGVIYISYGTNVSPSMFPPEKIQVLVEVFSELPYDVLWKWDKDELPNRSQNIRISKWLPQPDLLKHPKVKLFITQGGLQSTDEAITAGVPLIGMPMLGDQWFNVEKYIYHKVGVRLDMGDVTKDSFKRAINTVLNDDSYRKNMEKLRSVMHDQPQNSLERAVWWTEHLLRHGGASHLKALTANMAWTEYWDLELVTALGLCVVSILLTIGFLGKFLCSFIRHHLLSATKLKKS